MELHRDLTSRPILIILLAFGDHRKIEEVDTNAREQGQKELYTSRGNSLT